MEENLNAQLPSETPGDAMLQERNVRDEISRIDRFRLRIVIGWSTLLVAAGVTLFQAPAQYAALPLLPLLMFKKALLKYEELGSRKDVLLGSLHAKRERLES